MPQQSGIKRQRPGDLEEKADSEQAEKRARLEQEALDRALMVYAGAVVNKRAWKQPLPKGAHAEKEDPARKLQEAQREIMQQSTKIATLDKGIASKVKFAETVTPTPEQLVRAVQGM